MATAGRQQFPPGSRDRGNAGADRGGKRVTEEQGGRLRAICPVVPVRDDDTPDTLAARILAEEHRIYPEAIDIMLAGGWRIEGRRFIR